MANIPPKYRQSMRCHPKDHPTKIPTNIIQNIMVHAAMTAVPPTFTSFLKLNSNPTSEQQEYHTNLRPCMDIGHINDRRSKRNMGLAKKPATI